MPPAASTPIADAMLAARTENLTDGGNAALGRGPTFHSGDRKKATTFDKAVAELKKKGFKQV